VRLQEGCKTLMSGPAKRPQRPNYRGGHGTRHAAVSRVDGLPLSQFGALSESEPGIVVAASGLTMSGIPAVLSSNEWTRLIVAARF
jgi:hypothetical protein